jgi:endonuclease YncB( thermonuclease family)
MGTCFSLYRLRSLDEKKVNRRTYAGVRSFAKIVKIYDGDTFTIVTKLNAAEPYYQYQLRLAGIDAPELKPLLGIPDRDLHVQAGQNVRDIIKNILPEGALIWVEFAKEDKYGRLLGTVHTVKRTCFWYTPDYNLCNWLVEKRYALPYSGKTKTDFSTSFLRAIPKLEA